MRHIPLLLGIGFVEKFFRKSYIFIKNHYKQVFIQAKQKIKFLDKFESSFRGIQSNRIYSIKKIKNSKELTVFIIIFSIIFGFSYSSLYNFDKKYLLQFNFQYFYEDDTIEIYFYIKENVSKGSILFMPNFSNQHFEINHILYDYNITISQFTIKTRRTEFFDFVTNMKIDYLLLDKSDFRQRIYTYFSSSSNYELEIENSKYYFYKVI